MLSKAEMIPSSSLSETMRSSWICRRSSIDVRGSPFLLLAAVIALRGRLGLDMVEIVDLNSGRSSSSSSSVRKLQLSRSEDSALTAFLFLSAEDTTSTGGDEMRLNLGRGGVTGRCVPFRPVLTVVFRGVTAVFRETLLDGEM